MLTIQKINNFQNSISSILHISRVNVHINELLNFWWQYPISTSTTFLDSVIRFW